MSELKTLKDLPIIVRNKQERAANHKHDKVYVEDLRKELGVKWIKKLDEDDKLFSEPIPGSHGEYEGDRSNERLKDWIKHTFNLTKEDLK